MAGIVSLTVRLVDQFSNAAPKIVKAMGTVETAMAGPKAASGRFNNLAARIVGVTAGVAGLGAVAAGIGNKLRGMVRDSAEFEDMLQGIAQTGEMTEEQLKSLRNSILRLAPQLGRMPDQIGDVADKLVAAGIAPDRVEKMLEPIGRVAVATRSEISDITKASQALFQNLGIGPDKLESTFDKVWLAAKRGNFELKDMAQFLPKLAAAAASRGMTGVRSAVELASAAQIVREGSGSPGQAATNLTDLILKSTAPQTVKKFEKVGIDIKAAMEEGLAKGQSPLETIILQTKKALAENKGLTVGDLFHDQQAQLALAKLIEKYEEFIKIRNEALGASGTIDVDFKKMTGTMKNELDRLDAEIDARKKRWGKIAEPWAHWRTDKLIQLNRWVGDLADRFPRLSKSFGGISLGMSDLLMVSGQLGPSLLGLASSLAIGKFLGLGKVLGGLGKVLWALLLPIRFVIGVIGGMIAELAVILGPLLLRGLKALGPLILRGLMALGPIVASALTSLIALLSNPVGWAVLAAAITAALVYYFREPIMKGLDEAWGWIKGKWGELTAWFSSIDVSGIFEAGAKIITALWDGMKSIGEKLMSWASGLVGRLKSLFSFSVSAGSPTLSLPNGAPLAATPQSYGGGKLAPAPALQRQASMTFNNSFNISGSDNPDAVAQRIVTALNRQRQSGLYDGALA
ncbi:hypothetical protein AFEL58S_02012 [Afipia felis]